MPYIIITLGPTGSGKTNLVEKTISHLELNRDYSKFLVDDLVENNQEYKRLVSQIINNVNNKCVQEGLYCLDKSTCSKCDTSHYYLQPTNELLQHFNDAYWFVRNAPSCVEGTHEDCNLYNDKQLKRAIADKKNIVLESTGLNIPAWVLSKDFIKKDANYLVIFAYSLVQFDQLFERNKKRLIESIKKFEESHANPAPRLPNIRHNVFKANVLQIKTTLNKLYEKCIKADEPNPSLCGEKDIDHLLLFNNTGKQMTLAFDNKLSPDLSPIQFDKMVNHLFGLNKSPSKGRGGGRGAKSLQKKKKKLLKTMKKKNRKHYL